MINTNGKKGFFRRGENMNVGLIFAGGTGVRMNTNTKPKQFLELDGKAIIIYTIEVFETHPEIDAIVVVCLEEWIPYLQQLIKETDIKKIVKVIPGGKNTQESQYLGLSEINSWDNTKENTVVLIHDGVRPLVDQDTITRNIRSVEKNGTAITVVPSIETVIYVDETECLNEVIDRKKCRMARAPQSYRLGEILEVHNKAIMDNRLDFIDSACMMQAYNKRLNTVEGNDDNIKITTPKDYYLFKALVEAQKNSKNTRSK